MLRPFGRTIHQGLSECAAGPHARAGRLGLPLRHRLSQEELAHRSKIHQTYLSGVERGRRNPSILVLERIAKALGTDVDEFFRRR